MDYSGSEWSSGCESGWTSYFDESSISTNAWQSGNSNTNGLHDMVRNTINDNKGDDNEEEDPSMVSDASSGPPTQLQEYYHQDYFNPIPPGYHCSASDTLPKESDGMKKKKKKNETDQQRGKNQQHHGYLDDTATSPAVSHSKLRFVATSIHQASIDHHAFHFSQNFPPADKFQSTHPKKSDSAEPSQMRGRIWK